MPACTARRFQSVRRDGWRDSCRLLLLPQWLTLERRLAGLQERPVLQQLRMVDFGPRLDEALLRARKAVNRRRRRSPRLTRSHRRARATNAGRAPYPSGNVGRVESDAL